LPFEILPLPRFDADNELHVQLAQLSRDGHAQIAPFASQIEGDTARARATARTIVQSTLLEIDVLTRELLSAPAPKAVDTSTASLFST